MRYTVENIIKFGMLFGYRVYDSLLKESTGYEYGEHEKYKANSKAELLNLLNI